MRISAIQGPINTEVFLANRETRTQLAAHNKREFMANPCKTVIATLFVPICMASCISAEASCRDCVGIAYSLLYAAQQEFDKQNYDAAIKWCSESIKESSFPDTYLLRAKCYQKIGRYDKAVSDFFTSRSLPPAPRRPQYGPMTEAEILARDARVSKAWHPLMEGQREYNAGRFEEATQLLTESLKLEKVWGARQLRAKCYQQMGLMDAAIGDWLELAKEEPDSREPLRMQAKLYAKQQNYFGYLDAKAKELTLRGFALPSRW